LDPTGEKKDQCAPTDRGGGSSSGGPGGRLSPQAEEALSVAQEGTKLDNLGVRFGSRVSATGATITTITTAAAAKCIEANCNDDIVSFSRGSAEIEGQAVASQIAQAYQSLPDGTAALGALEETVPKASQFNVLRVPDWVYQSLNNQGTWWKVNESFMKIITTGSDKIRLLSDYGQAKAYGQGWYFEELDWLEKNGWQYIKDANGDEWMQQVSP
jgi:hypothetical protein